MTRLNKGHSGQKLDAGGSFGLWRVWRRCLATLVGKLRAAVQLFKIVCNRVDWLRAGIGDAAGVHIGIPVPLHAMLRRAKARIDVWRWEQPLPPAALHRHPWGTRARGRTRSRPRRRRRHMAPRTMSAFTSRTRTTRRGDESRSRH